MARRLKGSFTWLCSRNWLMSVNICPTDLAEELIMGMRWLPWDQVPLKPHFGELDAQAVTVVPALMPVLSEGQDLQPRSN